MRFVTRGQDEAVLADIPGGLHDTRTLAETVAERLRDLIISGQLQPGTSLRLAPLAEQLGVSIMPVREAFRLLETERLVVVTPRRKTVVAELSVDDIEETYAVRVALEGLAARHATERLTAVDIADIDTLFARMAEACDANDLQAFIAADREFHRRLYAASGRDNLVRTIAELENRSRRYASYVYSAWQPLDIALRAHQPLVDAIEAGDPALVEGRTREHITAAGARLLASVRRESDERSKSPALRRAKPKDAGQP
jgi:DNA-binding GntR family transcriptional regulator